MTDKRGDGFREIIEQKNLYQEPLFCDIVENYLCIKKHQGRFEVVHDRSGIRVSGKWTGADITKKLLG